MTLTDIILLVLAAKYLAVFVVMTITDFVWGRYTAAIADRRAMPAAIWSTGIILLGSYVTTAYISDAMMVIPAAAGAFAGTWLSVRFSKVAT